MKARVQTLSTFFSIAIIAVFLNAGPASADVYQGCETCGVFGCQDVWDGSYGNEGCESSWGMNVGNFGIVCNTGSSICYKDSISIDVTVGGGDANEDAKETDNATVCAWWEYLLYWC